ncbi:MAG: flagellin, partial [Micavibrio sp.]|nr:flagellin [Micavibrio sp.]
ETLGKEIIMSSDVVLTSALRTNLLSLQNTQSLIDKTQLKLATGLKVNSALDNPQSFFAAEGLDNRASDLTRLLDGISQSIRTIEEADNGVTALNSLIEQAQSVVSTARDELASSAGEARIVGTVDLSEESDLATLAIDDGDQFSIFTTDADGTQITQEITISSGDTIYSLAAQITDAFADNEEGEITASVTDEGTLSIQSTDGRSFRVTDDVNGANLVTQAGFDALGLGDYFADQLRNGASVGVGTTVIGGSTIESVSLFENTGDVVEAGDTITGTYTDADGNTVLSAAATSTIGITVNLSDGSSPTTTNVTGADTFQALVDSVNLDTGVNDYISANFDSATGKLSFSSNSDEVLSIEVTYTEAAGGEVFDIGLGDPEGALDPITTAGAGADEQVFRFNNSTQALDSLADDYNNIRSQIDDIVADAQYRGTNLLQGDDLTTFFNEDSSSRLTTEGATFTANGLGLNEATFRSSAGIEATNVEARNALNSVRSFGSTLSNNLSIIQTRQTFTEQTINTLQAGADDLTVADQNEEGANLLALQTRQQLGVTSLSLASQSQQAVLRLF